MPLGDRQILFFLHIPKTAGITMTSIIESNFAPDQILGPQDWREARREIAELSVAELARIRCVRGHFWFGPGDEVIHDRLAVDPVVITMLRAPVARTISVYQHVMRWPQHWLRDRIGLAPGETIPLEEFVAHPGAQTEISNLQTRLIVGNVPGNPIDLDDPDEEAVRLDEEELLARATARLESFAWVGVTERMDASVRLLNALMGWPEVSEVPKLNPNEKPSTAIEISEQVREEILARNQLDLQVYAQASRLLEEAIVLHPDVGG